VSGGDAHGVDVGVVVEAEVDEPLAVDPVERVGVVGGEAEAAGPGVTFGVGSGTDNET
jgi:hypothetical protein